MLILVVVGLLALGVMIGGIFAGIVTGDWRDTIISAVGMGVLVACLVVVVTASFMRAAKGTDRTISKLPKGIQIASATVLVAVAAVVVLIPSADAIGRIGTNQSLLTGPNQQRAVDALDQVVGGREFNNIYFYDSYVIAQAPTRPGADTIDNYQFRYDRADRIGPEPDSSGFPKTEVFDASGVDFAVIPRLVTDAEKRSGITLPTDVYVSVMLPPDAESGATPVINVNVEDDYGVAQVHYSSTGKFLGGSGDAFSN